VELPADDDDLEDRPGAGKRVHLELGGKAPVIVFDDADVEKAAEAIAMAGYFNADQDCTAATRVLAAPAVHDDFVAALTTQAKATRWACRTTRTSSTARSTTRASWPG
jgi:acyl-CoA reductase-like NAD-dependent aldehyde dehydrogenase